ncbi:hypothetical protein R3W88_021103 [Solanum pinnatisectum]|uniref:F-box associated beta-propeller type 3 domain-containing protein n=1 Tax=Solanum pinnatisectum TaxID=50273 RepID=A0AAV9LTL9_9SOLN|nr:hypothetical protein R3W88_021103 [Solanum pinnatisectum]
MKANRRKNIHKWEHQDKKKPKMKIWRKSSNTEDEGNYAKIDYFNMLSDDVITSLLLRCNLKSLSMLKSSVPSFSPEKEYKVVHFFYSVPSMTERWCYLGDLKVSHLKCEVLTINKVGGISLNRWKEIADRSPCHPRSEGQIVNEWMQGGVAPPHPCIDPPLNVCIYWWTYCISRARVNRILSFDFENEKIETISPPSSFEGDVGLFVMDLKGMLCVPDADCFYRSSILDLWILEDKISCNWVKEYSIRLIDFGSNKIMYVFMTCKEEIIFQNLDKVVFYDLKGKSFRQVEALSDRFYPYGVYPKSLFSLGTI